MSETIERKRHDSGCRNTFPMPTGVTGTAIFRGEHDEHRIYLERILPGCSEVPVPPFALWLGLNPSGAEADRNDLTIAKESHWTETLGYRRYCKVNVGTYRWTDSTTLAGQSANLIHPENVPLILKLCATAGKIIIATGKPPPPLEAPARSLFRAMKMAGHKALCLGTTQGWPKHSSRLAYATPFEEYPL